VITATPATPATTATPATPATPATTATTATTANALNSSNSYSITGTFTSSDITTTRTSATTTGYVYYGNTGTKYAGFDGTNFVSSMPMNFNILGSSASCTGNAATATTATTANALNTANSYTGVNFTATGTVYSSGASGFVSSTYVANSRNPIWSFGNASSYGLSYFQGSAGIGSVDTIGLHPNGTATASGSSFSVTASGNGSFAGTVTANNPFFLNSQTVSSNYTIPANFNAMSSGKITINTGVVVTVSTGSRWVVV